MPETPFIIRPFIPDDLPACRKLYKDGMLGGKLAENDTGLDMDDIQGVYMRPGNNFWVAEVPAAGVVGMIGVQQCDEGSGEIRRLRVDPTFRRRGIGYGLVETAVRFCQENQYLKITLDTFLEREPAVKLFEKFRFKHSRTKHHHSGKEMLYFYLDLYTSEARKK